MSGPKILVSACLLGEPVRYDGRSKTLADARLTSWLKNGWVLTFCPETAGGLATPRDAAEIQGGDGAAVINQTAPVVTMSGADVTQQFLQGAQLALAQCQQQCIRVALLTETSPSCGSGQIYDGSFTRQHQPGIGVTSALLREHGIQVFNQHQTQQAERYMLTGD